MMDKIDLLKMELRKAIDGLKPVQVFNVIFFQETDVASVEKGLAVACKIKKRHETLSRFFSLLGLDDATQKHDIEGIEHHLSSETLDVLADLASFLEKNPEVLQRFLKARKAK